eukprot:Nitzschia sp. Nitz4//scaffold11_size288233//185687//187534//NITZ4_000794-RA/size288233-processed-gene-0.176-mRNA-1//1//CDS//3329534134//4696//frame0
MNAEAESEAKSISTLELDNEQDNNSELSPPPPSSSLEEFADELMGASVAATTPAPPVLSLPWVLQLLFGFNGFSLSVLTLALLYVVNSRVQIPLAYLPTYGAIAFLPNSLKPIYAYLSHKSIPRYQLYAMLTAANGLALMLTCLIPTGGVFLMFLASFSRGVFEAWAELCLGLTLIDHAQTYAQLQAYDYASLASKFQAQAAASRSTGSLIANVFTCLLFLERYFYASDQTQLSGAVANALLILTGLLQLAGAAIAVVLRNEFQPKPLHTFTLIQNVEAALADDFPSEGSGLRDEETSHPSYSSGSSQDGENSIVSMSGSMTGLSSGAWSNRLRANGCLVILVQITVLVLAMKGPMVEATSHLFWHILLVSLIICTGLLGIAIYSRKWWNASHRVGLYLILRNMVPSDIMILGSYNYYLFGSKPLQLQLLSLAGMGVSTLAAATYSKYLSQFNSGNPFMMLIAATTILGAVASLGDVIVYENSSSENLFWIALMVQLVTTYFSELEFLPKVILATTSLSVKDNLTGDNPVLDAQDPATPSLSSTREPSDSHNVAIEYGTLISCIDFGDQLGALLTAPLIALLEISRENEFHNLNHFILLCALFSILTIGLLRLLY